MHVLIYQPAKSAMQSGRGGAGRWTLEFEAKAPRQIDPLMGWTSSEDTSSQVRLWFDSEEEAIAYAQKHGYMYSVSKPKARRIKPKAYADNFSSDRFMRWTH